ncbi:solute carrier organic anion transporter family member 74D-like [Penaeus indicus]|uniref:solute carrier organic anion transporter family member 74D-like n=1 Tax=Penaeus indicus TaxID=29960 RepID=UPI00300D9C4A
MDNPTFASEERLAFTRGRNMVDDDVKHGVNNGYMIRGKNNDVAENNRLNGGGHRDVIPSSKIIGEEKRDVKNNNHSLTNGKHHDVVEEGEISGDMCGGFGRYPKWLQCCAQPRIFLVVYCILNILGGAEMTFFMGSTTSFEKHFHFSSKDVGYIILFSEIGPIILSMVLSFLGGRGNRPRWMALGGFMSGVGTLAVFSAVLFYPPPTLSESGQLKDSRKFCSPEEARAIRPLAAPPTTSPSRLSSFSRLEVEEASCFLSNTFVFVLFLVGRSLKGIGNALNFTLGSSYLDDSIKKKDSPVYFAMSTTLGIVGPFIGFSLSAFAQNIYVLPGQHHGILPSDPRWVGAWWVGPLVFSSFMFIFAFGIALFPRKMKKPSVECGAEQQNGDAQQRHLSNPLSDPGIIHTSVVPCDNLEQPKTKERNGGTKERNGGMGEKGERGRGKEERGGRDSSLKKKTGDESSQETTKTALETKTNSVQELRVAMGRILSNKVVVCLSLADFFAIMGAAGLFFWLPKYFEHQFRTSKAKASLFTGISGTTSVILGVAGGGVWIRRFRPTARTVALTVSSSLALYMVSLFGLMSITCDFNDDLPGILSVDKRSIDLYRGCSGGCMCSQQEFVPVCVRDGPIRLTYFSPCHAGCPDIEGAGPGSDFFNCTCGSPAASVTQGHCRETCSGFFLYNVVMIIIKAFLSVGTIGGILINLRCVAEEDKPLALGLKATMLALAVMANPLVFGSLVDSACLVWEEVCGEKGSCWVYSSDDFRYKLHGMACAMFAVSIVFMSQAARHVGDLKLMEDAAPASDVASALSSGPPSLFSEFADGKEPAEGGRKEGGRGISEKDGKNFSRGVAKRLSGRRRREEAEENGPTQPPQWRVDEGREERDGLGRGYGGTEEGGVGGRSDGTGARRERREGEREDGRGGGRNGRDSYRQVTPYAYPGEMRRPEEVPHVPRNEVPRDFSRSRQNPHILPSNVIKTTGV